MLSLRVSRRLEHPVFLCSRRRGSRQSRLDPSYKHWLVGLPIGSLVVPVWDYLIGF